VTAHGWDRLVDGAPGASLNIDAAMRVVTGDLYAIKQKGREHRRAFTMALDILTKASGNVMYGLNSVVFVAVGAVLVSEGPRNVDADLMTEAIVKRGGVGRLVAEAKTVRGNIDNSVNLSMVVASLLVDTYNANPECTEPLEGFRLASLAS
jgi:hypothetical protein